MIKYLYTIGKDVDLKLVNDLCNIALKYTNIFDVNYKSRGDSSLYCTFENSNKRKEFEDEYNKKMSSII